MNGPDKKQDKICFIDLELNQPALITNIATDPKTTKRLADLGLTTNTKIELVRKIEPDGPVELKARGSNLVLGKGIVSKIFVVRA